MIRYIVLFLCSISINHCDIFEAKPVTFYILKYKTVNLTLIGGITIKQTNKQTKEKKMLSIAMSYISLIDAH